MQEHMDEIEAEFSGLHNQDNRDELEQKNKKRHISAIALYIGFLLIPSLIYGLFIIPVFRDNNFVFKDYSASEYATEIAASNVNSLLFINESTYQSFTENYDEFLFQIYVDGNYSIYAHTYATYFNETQFIYENNKVIGIKEEILNEILAGTLTEWNNKNPIQVLVPMDDAAPIFIESAIYEPTDLIEPARIMTTNFSNIYSFVIYIVFTLIMMVLMKPSLKLDLPSFKEEKATILNRVLSGIVTIFAINIVTNIIVTVLTAILGVSSDISSNQLSINRSLASPFMILMIFTAVILAPIIEELVFRKAFFGLIKNPKIALIASSVCFGLIHVTTELTQGNLLGTFIAGLSYIAGGISLGLIYMNNKKNIYIPIIVHSAYNLIGMLMQLFLA